MATAEKYDVDTEQIMSYLLYLGKLMNEAGSGTIYLPGMKTNQMKKCDFVYSDFRDYKIH